MRRGEPLTAIVAIGAVEARLELVAAAALAAHAVVEALDVGRQVAGSSRRGEGEEDRVANEHLVWFN